MALPTYKGSGTFTNGTASITPPMPTGGAAPAANDILLLVCESENQAITLTTANGFVEITNSPQSAGTAATDPGSRLAVFWKRAVGSDAAPVVADAGDHTTGQIHCFSGCRVSGNPWDVLTAGNNGAANSTSVSIGGTTTTVPDCLVVLLCSSSFNGNSTAEFSAWANTDLANLTERTDNTSTSGLGGGHGMATGEKATAGAFGSTTLTLAHTSFVGCYAIALAGVLSGSTTPAGSVTAQEALVASALRSGAATVQGSPARVASSPRAATGSTAASATRLASAVLTRTLVSTATASRLASSVLARTGMSTSGASRVASSVHAGTGTQGATAVRSVAYILTRTVTLAGVASLAGQGSGAGHMQAHALAVASASRGASLALGSIAQPQASSLHGAAGAGVGQATILASSLAGGIGQQAATASFVVHNIPPPRKIFTSHELFRRASMGQHAALKG